MITPEMLRTHARAADTAAWAHQARQLLKWAADTLEAAQKVIDERNKDRAGEAT